MVWGNSCVFEEYRGERLRRPAELNNDFCELDDMLNNIRTQMHKFCGSKQKAYLMKLGELLDMLQRDN